MALGHGALSQNSLGGVSGTTAPAAPTSIKWRLNVSANNGRATMGFAEIWLRPGPGVAMPSGTAAASSQFDATFAPANAVDRSTSTLWLTASTQPGIWYFDFTVATAITNYEIQSSTTAIDANPKTWTLDYYDGSAWVTVDTRTNVTNWTLGEIKGFTVGSGVTAQVSQVAVEVIRSPVPNAQVSQTVIEVIRTNGVEAPKAPTKQLIQSLEFAFGGQPFVQLGAVSGASLDYAFGGQPFAIATTFTPAPTVIPPVVTRKLRLQQFLVMQ